MTRTASADTIQAPAGGKAVSLGERVVCGAAPAGWTIEREGRALRPPAGDDALGRTAEIKVAPATTGCGTGGTPVTLVVTGKFPVIDAASLVVSVDDLRAELRGKRLKGTRLVWRAGAQRGDDTCLSPKVEKDGESCLFGIGRGVPADPAATFTWLPPLASTADDAQTFDENGRLVPRTELGLHPARVVVNQIVASNIGVDVAAGGGSARIALTHPEAVTSVDCAPAVCEVEEGKLAVRGVTQAASSLRARFRLLPRVVLAKGDTSDASPAIDIPILRCPMTIESGAPLRDVDDSRIVVKIEGRCVSDVASMRFFADSRPAEAIRAQTDKDAVHLLLGVGRLHDEVTIRGVRGEGEGSVVAVAKSTTRPLPPIRAVLELDDGQPIDFIPTNRAAIVRVAPPADGMEVVVLPVDGVYSVTNEGGVQKVRATSIAGGYAALRYAIRITNLPPAIRDANVTVIREPFQRPLREGHIPAPLQSIVDLRCTDRKGAVRLITPGVTTNIPYVERDGCFISMHRDRVKSELGAQKLVLDIDVQRVDGSPKPEGHVNEPTTLRPGEGTRVAFLHGATEPFDRVTVRIAHAQDEQFYQPQGEQPLTPPAAQWSIITSTAAARVYLTATIPTVLYRVSDTPHSGILSLNFGVLSRLTWVDSEGRDGILAVEAGVLGVGLAPVDTSASGQNLRQVATVTGLGLGMPIANRALATQASINLHAWFEYEIARAIGTSDGSPFAFVFGPSITFGNVGAYL